jgi:gas vesicle protein
MSEHNAYELESTEGRFGNTLAWFCVGAAIGAAAGILYAPKSGKETREYLSKKTQEGCDAVESTANTIVEQGREFFEKSRHVVDDTADLFERGRKLVRG